MVQHLCVDTNLGLKSFIKVYQIKLEKEKTLNASQIVKRKCFDFIIKGVFLFSF